jgi:hypothetical protein
LWLIPGEVDADGPAINEAERSNWPDCKVDSVNEAEAQSVLATKVKRRRDTLAELESQST